MKIRILAALVLFASACGGAELEVGGDAGSNATSPNAETSTNGVPNTASNATTNNASGADAGGDAGVDPDAGTEPDMEAPPEVPGPARYPTDALISPVTSHVVDSMTAIRSGQQGPDDSVFMKVGASGTVNSNFLDCLDSASLALGDYEALRPTVTHFAGSWERNTLAAEVGRTAGWVQSGTPSPLEREIAATNPRFALVNYGTNDMQQGITHETALWPFWNNMWTLLTGLIADGIVPVVTGLNPRSDSVEAAYWVPTYNEVTRAMAQTLQLPYIDLYQAVVDLNDLGLVSDGIHGNSAPSGACSFDAAGLAYNYNTRNLLTLRTLDMVRSSVIEGSPAPDRAVLAFAGDGLASDPFEIDQLPFAHHDSTLGAPTDAFDAYPACDSGQNESGPERIYQLQLDQPTRLRAMVFDDDADIDLHHLAGSLDPAACNDRDDRIIQGTFAAGTHYFVLDTFVSSASGERAGEYTFVVVQCEAGDTACD